MGSRKRREGRHVAESPFAPGFGQANAGKAIVADEAVQDDAS